MTKIQQINETTIKSALAQGHITAKEARQMHNIYLHRSGSSSIPKKVLNRKSLIH